MNDSSDTIGSVAQDENKQFVSNGTAWELMTSGGGGAATQITETSGPTTLDIAAISDGQYLIRSGTDVVGATLSKAATSDIDDGTDDTKYMTAAGFVASTRDVRYASIRVIAADTDWSADGTSDVGGDFIVPFTGTLVSIRGDVDTAGTSDTSVVDVNKNGTTIMDTNKLKWDSGEKSTTTYSGTAPALSTTAISSSDILTVDIDTNHKTKSKGLTVTLGIRMI
jgi:hypothetical protein